MAQSTRRNWPATHVPPTRQAVWILAILLVASFLARLVFVETNEFSYDETHNLMFGTLASAGFTPYREVFVGIAPFALLTVQWSAELWNASDNVRLPMVLYGLLGVAAIFAMTRRAAPQRPLLAAAVATLLFSFNPLFFAASTTINLEAAALAFGLLAVWAMPQGPTRHAWGWIGAAGVLFGLSLGIKVLVPFVPGVILLQMLVYLQRTGWLDTSLGISSAAASWPKWLPRLVRIGLIWLAGLLLVGLLFALAYDPRLVYEQAVAFRLDLRAVTLAHADSGIDVTEALTWRDGVQFVPLVLGALAAVPMLRRQRPHVLLVWGAWLLLSLVFVGIHVPLRPRHLVTVLPALAVLSGIGVASGWQLLAPRQWARAALAALALLTIGSSMALAASQARIEEFTDEHPTRAAVINYIQQTTAPDDCIVAKENRLHFLSGRLSTPYLSEVSTARLFSGLLNSASIMADVDRHDCAALVYDENLEELAPGLRQRAGDYYALQLVFSDPADDESLWVYAVPRNSATPPQQPLDVGFYGANGREIALRGFDLLPQSPPSDVVESEQTGQAQAAPMRQVGQGEVLYLSTYWQTVTHPSTDYRMFVHLIDAGGNLALAADHFPFELDPDAQITDIQLHPAYTGAGGNALPANYPNAGMIPTHLWQPSTTLKETIALSLDLSPGTYTLQIGWFDPVSGVRLDLNDAQPGGIENQVVLATFEVIAPK